MPRHCTAEVGPSDSRFASVHFGVDIAPPVCQYPPAMVSPTRFNLALMKDDMHRLGWLPQDLAGASGVCHMTVHRFLRGERENPRTALKLAVGLGQTLDRYLVRAA